MRDPKRIEKVLEDIKAIWKKYPDMRLGQLIGNVLEGPNLYYVEDKGLVDALRLMYEGAKEPIRFDEDAYIFDIIKKHPDELGFVLQAKDFKDYLASYENVSDNPEKDAELSEAEFVALKTYFSSKESAK